MKKKLLEVREFTDPGYQPVFDFDAWRVAILNYLDEIHPTQIASLERHNQTDEVFVMLKGQGILFIGEGEINIEKLQYQVMEAGKLYNVKRGVWHSVVLSREGSVLIVENRNTSKENTDYSSLDLLQRHMIIDTSLREKIRI